MKEVTVTGPGGRKLAVETTLVDRVIGYFSPERAVSRLHARAQLAMAGGYKGASKSRRQTMGWKTRGGDADAQILPDLESLRERSRDLERNAPLACGALSTKETAIVGTGLKPRAAINRDILKLSDDQADAWERQAELEFRLATGGKDFALSRDCSFLQSQALVLRSRLSSGDVFVNLPRKARPGNPYTLRIQIIEADRVCNPDNRQDTATLIAGVEKDDDGAPVRYHIAKFHPGNLRAGVKREWMQVEAFNNRGQRNILHIFKQLRPGQTRGVPDLAPVIEMLKSISDYTDSELHAAVVASFFTVFVKSSTGDPQINMPAVGGGATTQAINTDGMELGSGSVLGLMPGEDIVIADPKRPNSAAEVFLRMMAEQVGVALELPYELLVKHFTASYSAARAALLEAWRYFMRERAALAEDYCQPIWEAVITEAVARGRLAAPGVFADPLVRMAYLGCEWTGDAMGQLDEVKAATASEKRVAGGFSTKARETVLLNGGDWERDERQRAKEEKLEGVRLAARGVAVRAGAITPQFEDEALFRRKMNLPEPSASVKTAWEDDGNVRRPITLKAGDAFAAEQEAVAQTSEDNDDATD
jgi:lambda family phage portal protein